MRRDSRDLGSRLRSLEPDEDIVVELRGESFRLRVIDVDVETTKPEIYARMYHVHARGESRRYRLFTSASASVDKVKIEHNTSKGRHTPVWKCIGTLSDLRSLS